jgi:hypothetical protein
MAAPSLTYTLTNGTPADASQVQQNFSDLLNGITDGTKDLSISALTLAGAFTANGNVTLGNASSDDLTVTASLASHLVPKTTNTYDFGSSTIGVRSMYLGANSQTVRLLASSSMSATWTMTLPVTAGTSEYVLTTNGSGVTSWTNRIATSMGDVLATSLGYKRYVPGGSYSGGGAPTISGTNWTTGTDSTFIPYQAQDGTWRLRFNIYGTISVGATSLTLTVNGVTFQNLTGTNNGQPIAVRHGATAISLGQVNDNTSTIGLTCNSSTTEWGCSGDVALESKPTWAY